MAAASAAEVPPAETALVEAQDSAAPSPLKQRKLDFDRAEDEAEDEAALSKSPMSIAAPKDDDDDDCAHVRQMWKEALLGDGGSDCQHHEGSASSSKAMAVEPAAVAVKPTPVQPAQARASAARGPVVYHTPPVAISCTAWLRRPPGLLLGLQSKNVNLNRK